MERTKERSSFRKKFIGDRKFYMMVLAVAVPIMIQNGITNFVSLLDNIMIGRIGTEQMSGASIVNQLIFVYNLCIFGGVSGAGIFTAQYFGQKDHEGVRQTFRYKFWMAVILTIGTILMFLTVGENLISMYLSEFYTPLVPKGYDFLGTIGELTYIRQDGQVACEAKATGTD